MTETKFT